MAEITLPLLGEDPIVGAAINPSRRRVQDVTSSAEKFSQALNRQREAVESLANTEVASPIASSAPPVGGKEGSPLAEDRANARRALNLDSAKPVPSTTSGDAILGGMQKMRSIFDVREHSISKVQQSNLVDTQTLMEMQKEIVQYTMLLDVTSKLSGKASQTVDQLMKGQ